MKKNDMCCLLVGYGISIRIMGDKYRKVELGCKFYLPSMLGEIKSLPLNWKTHVFSQQANMLGCK